MCCSLVYSGVQKSEGTSENVIVMVFLQNFLSLHIILPVVTYVKSRILKISTYNELLDFLECGDSVDE